MFQTSYAVPPELAWFDFDRGKRLFCSPKHSHQQWGLLSLLFSGHQGLLPRDNSGRVMKFIIHFHSLPTLRISRAVPPFLYAFIVCTGRNLPLYQKNSVFNVSSRWESFKATFPNVSMIYFTLENSLFAMYLTYRVTAFLHLLVWYWILHSLFPMSVWYTGCNRRNRSDFGRVFLRSNYTDITQNTYIQSWTVTEMMAREVWNFDSCYSLIDYQIHIETGRNMWFL